MTSDAKIGLLLGLVFIFVIAFIINGLPGFHHKDDGNKLTTNMVGLNNPSGLGANERKVLEPAPEAIPVSGIGQPAANAAGATNARYTMALPQNNTDSQTAATAPPPAAEPVAGAPAAEAQPTAIESITPSQPQPVASVSNQPTESAAPAQPAIVKTAPATKPGSTKQISPNTYVVQDGDTLGAIAKKVYGPEQGNKLTNIEAIFEANRKTLSAMDDLKVGQKLIIPPLASSASNTPASALSGSNFTKVDSVGQRHTSANTEKPAAANKPAQATKADNSKLGKVYVVKEGDSLWQIASEQLGDGNRYKEIVKLNSDILSSEDDIQVDMKLKLPAK